METRFSESRLGFSWYMCALGFFAYDRGDHLEVVGEMSIGETSTLISLYTIVAALRDLLIGSIQRSESGLLILWTFQRPSQTTIGPLQQATTTWQSCRRWKEWFFC